MADKVQLEIKGHVATITLNKPERLNALDVEMWEAIGESASAIDEARDVRVAVLKGANGAFCAGLDVKAGSTLSSLDVDGSPGTSLAAVRRHLGHLQSCFNRLEACRVPVIAALERVCVGGGLRLAACCDSRPAAQRPR